ncbi:MAG: prefoldin subunit beta [Methanoculleaceae archaeon]
MDNLSPKVQNQLAMLQQIQQQLQTVAGQKSQYQIAIKEANRALEELKDVPEDTEVFMNAGSIIVQKDVEQVRATLNERVETMEIRVKSLEKQEKALQSRFEQLSQQIRAALEKKAPSAS